MRTPSLRRLLLQFAASGLIAVLLVALAAVYAFRRAGERESVRDARRVTEVLATSVIQPRLRDSILQGDPKAIEALDTAVRPNVVRDPVVRVKLWSRDGRIVYSDEPRLIGSQYRLESDERSAFTGRSEAEVSDLSRPENRFERGQKKLLEVYTPVKTKQGRMLLFEAYLRFSSVSATGRQIWFAFVPALVIGLMLLWLAQVPLALSLARRLRGGQRDREGLLLRALEASDTERRRIASDLHDGAVQRLAGTSFSLAGAAERAPDEESRRLLRSAAASTRRAVRELRSLLVELHPPSLHGAGLEAALSDLLERAKSSGAATELRVESDVALSVEQESLVFRTAQEAVRNVAMHAAASRVEVTLAGENGSYELCVSDDGVGFVADERTTRRAHGHLGLELLADRARDLGATLTVESQPGQGTTIKLRGPTS